MFSDCDLASGSTVVRNSGSVVPDSSVVRESTVVHDSGSVVPDRQSSVVRSHC